MMKKLSMFGLVITIAIALCGCNSTSTIEEFDSNGKLVKKTTTKESVVEQITASTKDKTVFVWDEGWIAGVRAEPSSENIICLEMIAMKKNRGVLSVHKDQQNMPDIKNMIQAAKNPESLSLSATGISSGKASESASTSAALASTSSTAASSSDSTATTSTSSASN